MVRHVLDLNGVAERGESLRFRRGKHDMTVHSLHEINAPTCNINISPIVPLSHCPIVPAEVPSQIQLKDFVCQSCDNILDEPVETKCRHSVCKHCMCTHLLNSTSTTPSCPCSVLRNIPKTFLNLSDIRPFPEALFVNLNYTVNIPSARLSYL